MHAALLLALLAAPPSEDFDRDGLPDVDDDCPTEAGPKESKGCAAGSLLEDPPPVPRVALEPGRLSLPEPIRFRAGSAVIDPASDPLLAEAAKVLASLPERVTLRIVGHTDAQGSAAKNVALSRARAEAVLERLARTFPRDRMRAEGKGPHAPLAKNDTPAGRAKNRRVELLLVEP